jgi:hypothetical protein
MRWNQLFGIVLGVSCMTVTVACGSQEAPLDMRGGFDQDAGQDASTDASTDDLDDGEDEPVLRPGKGACSMRHCDARASLFSCFEWGVDDSQHMDFCTQLGGEIGAGACPVAEDRVGGCKSSSPFTDEGCVIDWLYGPYVGIEDVRSDCNERGGELLD